VFADVFLTEYLSEVDMIRLLFSVGDGVQTPKSFHTIDLSDEKAKLLLQSTAVVIGVENRNQFSDFLRDRLREADQAEQLNEELSRPGGVTATWNDGGMVIPEPLAGEIQQMFCKPNDAADHGIIELEMQSVLTPGVWVMSFTGKKHFLIEIHEDKVLDGPVPAKKISEPIVVKFPPNHRLPEMPQDYGCKVFYRDREDIECYSVKTGTLQGFDTVKKVFIVFDDESHRMMYSHSNEVWIVDKSAEKEIPCCGDDQF